MNYHSVCLHVLADSIRRYNILPWCPHLSLYLSTIKSGFHGWMIHEFNPFVLILIRTHIYLKLVCVNCVSVQVWYWHPGYYLSGNFCFICILQHLVIFLPHFHLFLQGSKCWSFVFRSSFSCSFYACHATLQSNWWYLAPNGSTKHSTFCIK